VELKQERGQMVLRKIDRIINEQDIELQLLQNVDAP
jgi:hypothetical protein